MADYSSVDYSGGYSNPSDVFESPSSIGGYDWGRDTPFNNTYTPTIQQEPAKTSWMDVVKGLGIVFDAAGNAVRAYRGMPAVRGGPYDQFMTAEANKDQANLISSILDRYTKRSKEEREIDPKELLWTDRILDPTKPTTVAGITGDKTFGGLPRLAGSIFGLS